jgi:hypothetical protein
MTRKHYQLLADMIRREYEVYENDAATLASVADTLATICKADNPRFDRDRFLEACGMPDGEWAI